MQIKVDVDRCISGGQCVMSAPDLFDQDDDGIVVLLGQAGPGQQQEEAREAARLCPASAIEIDE
jgi:ferredoxin